DLMRAPRLEADIEECIPREELHDLEVRNGVPRRLRVERVPQWIAAVAADRCLDPPAAGPRTAHDECAVLPLERAPAHEGLEPPMRLVGARDDHQAGCVAIESMHDPGPVVVAARGVVRKQAVDERAT